MSNDGRIGAKTCLLITAVSRYFTLLHVGAVGYHLLKGDVILARMGIGAFPK